MAEYSSPIQNSRRGSNRNSNDDNESNNYYSFVNTPSPARHSLNNWSNRRNLNYRNNVTNQYERHSTPQNRSQNRMYNRPNYSSPNNHGFRPRNFDNKFNANDYFHPSMLENPWAELEKKYEKSMAQASENESQKKTSDSSCSSSDSE